MDPSEEDTLQIPIQPTSKNLHNEPLKVSPKKETVREDGSFFRRAPTTPFGLSDTISLWLRADVGLSYGGPNDTINSWADQSGRGLDPTVPGGAAPSLSNDLINFNPALSFDNTDPSDYLDLSQWVDSIFTKNNSFYIVSANTRNASPQNHRILFYVAPEIGSFAFDYDGFGGVPYDFEFHVHRDSTSNVSGIFLQDTESTFPDQQATEIGDNNDDIPWLTTAFYQGDPAPGDTGFVAIADNGSASLAKSDSVNIPGDMDITVMHIGRHAQFTVTIDDADTRYNMNGDIAEIIVYGDSHTDASPSSRRNKIETYLGIKYSIQLDTDRGSDVVNFDYIASNGDTIWPGTSDAAYQAYHHQVAGIGRDDASILNQKQSKASTDSILTIGLGAIAASNALNPSTFGQAVSFLVWGHDDASAHYNDRNTTDVPNTVTERMSRVWHVKNTGNVGAVDIWFDLNDFGSYSTDIDDMQLIVSDVPVFAKGTVHRPESYTSGVVKFDDVVLKDGQYFTLGTQEKVFTNSPGGIRDNLRLWLKADGGFFTSNDEVITWADSSGYGHDAVNVGLNRRPTFVGGDSLDIALNFNPVVAFDDANEEYLDLSAHAPDVFTKDNSFYYVLSGSRSTGVTDKTYIVLYAADNDAPTVGYNGFGGDDDLLEFHLHYVQFPSNSGSSSALFVQDTSGPGHSVQIDGLGIPAYPSRRLAALSHSFYTAGDSVGVARDNGGIFNSSHMQPIPQDNHEADSLFIGRHVFQNSQALFLDGNISEIIVYGGYSALTPSEREANRKKIESYLAIKYGIGLGLFPFFNPYYDYVTSDGTVIWPGESDASYQGYHYNVAGIGRDNAPQGSGLLQKQSMPSNRDGPGVDVIIGIDTIVADNASHPGNFDDNLDFLVFGSDNALTAAAFVDTTDVPDSVAERMERRWRVKNTGNVGAVDIHFLIRSSLNYGIRKLSDYTLIVSGTETMASGTKYPAASLNTSISGDTVKFDDIVLPDGYYFSLGTRSVASAPGAQEEDLLLWLKADKGLAGTSVITAWDDQSGNNYDPDIPNPKKNKPSLSNNLVNFNPAVAFDETNGQFLDLDANAGGIFTKNNAFFIVSANTSGADLDIMFHASDGSGPQYNGGGDTDVLEFYLGRDASYQNNIFLQDGPAFTANATNTSLNTDIPMLTTAYYKAGDSVGVSSNGNSYVVDNSVASATYAATELRVGGHQSTGTRHMTGDIAEVVVYGDHNLSQVKRDRIESYLALKYGITIDRNLSSDTENFAYVNSIGDTIWDGNDAGYQAYHHAVAGIGRDNGTVGSEFHQKQSMSSGTGTILIMGIDTIVADNASNTASFDDNLDFLVWGHNDSSAAQSAVDSIDVPSDVSKRMNRIWRVRNTGNVEGVDVHFVLTGLGYGTPALTDFKLIVSGTSTMADGMTVAATSFANDTVKFDNVTFSDGQYFSLGVEAPFTRLLWLKADAGTTFQGTNDTLSAWLDQTTNGYAPTISKGPYLSDSLINFNPAIYFDEDDSALVDLSAYASNIITKDNAFFIVSDNLNNPTDDIMFYASDIGAGGRDGFGSGSSAAFELHVHRLSNLKSGIFVQDSASNDTAPNVNESGAAPTANNATITSAFYKSSDSTGVGSNGNAFTTQNAHDDTHAPQTVLIGRHYDPNHPTSKRFFDGDIAEIIVYNKHDLPQSERDKVESYLALKYGITLDMNIGSTTNNFDYLSFDNTTVWPGTSDAGYQSYHNGIAGIGRDDESSLYQKQSRADGINTVLTVGLGTIAANNAANTNTLDDQDFFIWGHNDGSVNSVGAETSDVPATASERMARIWRVKNTGDVRNLELAFDLTGLGYTMTQTNFQLIVSGSATMANGWTYSADSISGNVVYFKNRNQNGADLGDGQYFTLGTARASEDPPVNAGLLLWLKADKGIIGNAGDPFNVWVDVSGNNYHATNFTGSGRPTVSNDSVNFNPGANFDEGSLAYLDLSANVNNILTKDNSIFIVSSNLPTNNNFDILMYGSDGMGDGTGYNGLGDAGIYEFHIHRQNGDNSPGAIFLQDSISSGLLTETPADLLNVARLTTAKYLAGDAQGMGIADNGHSFSTTVANAPQAPITPNYLFLGKHGSTSINTERYLDGDISEVLVYGDANLSALDRNIIESYLAIKYGITLDSSRSSASINYDYVSANGTVIWPGTSDPTYQAYHHDVAGIGRDDASDLLQLSSKSSNDDSGTLDTTYVTMSATSLENTRFLVWGNDGAAMENANNTELDRNEVQARLNREWRVYRTNGPPAPSVTFDLSTVSGPSGVGSSDLSLMRLMVDADGDFSTGASYYMPSSTDAPNNTVTFSSVNFAADGEYFTLGSTEDRSLPITLISFDVEANKDGQVELSWSTAQEINNSFFTIERSEEGTTFEEIAYLDGAGNSNETRNYQYTDRNPYTGGWSYYRLKQTDFNGDFEYSSIKRVNVLKGDLKFDIWPNPAKNALNISYNGTSSEPVTVKIMTVTGQEIRKHGFQSITSDPQHLDMSNIPNGVYLIVLEDLTNFVRITKKLIISKGAD